MARGLVARRAGRVGHAVDRVMTTLWRRGATEAALLLLAAAVASGVVFGAGVARASSNTSDGQTWIGRSDTGSVVQINPVTGQPVTEVDVGLDAGPKTVQQGDGVVLVTDPQSGKTVSFDIGTLLVTGSRTADGDDAKQLYRDGHAYIADLSHGVVRAVDPLTLHDKGEAYSAGGELSDVVVDDAGTVWALQADGTMDSLRWSDQAGRFIDQGTTRVNGAASGAKLVPHQAGVTMFAPGTGAIVQVGTGSDVAATVDGMTGKVLAAPTSPKSLTAAAVPQKSLTVILSGTSVYAAHMGADGCDSPGRPAVFSDRIYVPCDGDGRTVVLGPDGRKVGPDIGDEDGSDPVLTQDDDSLVIVTDDGANAVTVDQQGNTHSTDLGDGGVPVVVASTSGSPETTANAAVSSENAPVTSSSTSRPADGVTTSLQPPEPPTTTVQTTPSSATSPADSSSTTSSSHSPTPTTRSSRDDRPPDRRTTSSSAPPVGSTTASVHTATTGTTGPSGRGNGPANTTRGGGDCHSWCGQFRPATDVTATPAGSGIVQVSWTPPSPAPHRYLVQTTDGGQLTTAEATDTSVLISGLVPGDRLRFVVTADFDSARLNSLPSNVVVVGSGAPASSTDGGAVPSSGTSAPTSGTDTTEESTDASGTATSTDSSTTSTSGTSSDTSTTGTSSTTSSTATTSTTSSTSTSVTTSSTTSSTTSTSPTTSKTPTSKTSTSTSKTSTPKTSTSTSTAPAFPPVTGLQVQPGNGLQSSVQVSWTAPAGRTPESYHVVATIDGSSTTTVADPDTTSARLSFGFYQSPQPVTVSVSAVYSDGTSDPVTGSGTTSVGYCSSLRGPGGALQQVAMPMCDDPPCLTYQPPKPRCQRPFLNPSEERDTLGVATRGVADVSSGAATRSVHASAGESDVTGRYAAAAGLIALAGLIRFGRYRMDAAERDERRAGRRSRPERGRHQ